MSESEPGIMDNRVRFYYVQYFTKILKYGYGCDSDQNGGRVIRNIMYVTLNILTEFYGSANFMI